MGQRKETQRKKKKVKDLTSLYLYKEAGARARVSASTDASGGLYFSMMRCLLRFVLIRLSVFADVVSLSKVSRRE